MVPITRYRPICSYRSTALQSQPLPLEWAWVKFDFRSYDYRPSCSSKALTWSRPVQIITPYGKLQLERQMPGAQTLGRPGGANRTIKIGRLSLRWTGSYIQGKRPFLTSVPILNDLRSGARKSGAKYQNQTVSICSELFKMSSTRYLRRRHLADEEAPMLIPVAHLPTSSQ